MKAAMKIIGWLAIFSIAMGFMESAVVIYLRRIYYPGGFQFPLVALDPSIGLVELVREAATIIMLLGIGILSGKTASLRFAYFMFCFAVWDLFYYVFLWIFLGWPQSFFTWDILFLIPVPWVGPVLAPCIVSITMLLLAMGIIHFQGLGRNTRLNLKEWAMLSVGSFVIIVSFMLDYLRYMGEQSSNIGSVFSSDMSELKGYVPTDFNWALFLTGELIVIFGVVVFFRRVGSGRES